MISIFDQNLSTLSFDNTCLPAASIENSSRSLDSSLRYSPDQPRDDHGRFGESDGSISKDPNYNPNSKDLKAAIRSWKTGFNNTEIEKAAKTGDGKNPIINAIRNEDTGGKDIYRGVKALKDSDLTKAQVGDKIQVIPSSFSLSKDVADRFAVPLLMTAPGTDEFTGTYQPVVLHVSGNSQGVVLGDRETSNRSEQECISGGHYEVTSRTVTGSVIRLDLRQTGVF